MNQKEHSMIKTLRRAQGGDAAAHAEVAMYCFNAYLPRLASFYSQDPAISDDDLRSTFFIGVWDAVQKADGRGNPLYFIGQCGTWKVQSEVRTLRRRMKERARAIIGAHGWDERMWGDTTVEPVDPAPDFREIVASRLDDERMVHVIAHANLRDRSREALEVILAGEAGDPSEPGFNKRLAQRMKISPQRASQLTADLRAAYEAAA